MKIGVLSDIHANALALDAAIAAVDRVGVDEWLVLGDLLSYGVRPLEVLARLTELSQKRPTRFLVGNHDQLYFEMQSGQQGYFERMPAWVQESARWTATQLGSLRLDGAVPWSEQQLIGDTMFAHANPFGVGDWTYLSDAAALERAANALQARGVTRGVFGHTHRDLDTAIQGVRLLNPGSVGQPRNGSGRPSAAFWSDAAWGLVSFDYDRRAFRAEVEAAALSAPTKAEILKFHPLGAT